MIIYTIWAAMKDYPESFWMLAAEDEYSWEGDPDRCDAVFQTARDKADVNGWITREVEITVPFEDIAKTFLAGKTEGEVTSA